MNRIVFIVVIFIAILSCKNNEVFKENQAPGAFSVTANIVNNESLVLEWTKPFDSDNDKIKYSIYIGDTIATNLSDTTYTIKSLLKVKGYSGQIIANDNHGGISIATFNFENKINRPPLSFVVYGEFENKVSQLIKWKAIDPDGDKISYSIIVKDTLVKNYSDTTFKINVLEFASIDSGSVVAFDNRGGQTTSRFKLLKPVVEYADIPNENFEEALISLKIDDIKDGRILIKNAISTQKLNLAGSNISDLRGIESFINLEVLYLDKGNKLEEVNLSQNVKLTDLSIWGNRLKSIDLTNNTELKYLNLSSNKLSKIVLSSNVYLESLDPTDNPITELLLDKNTKLRKLSIRNNPLKGLDISKNVKMEEVFVVGTEINSLNTSQNVALKKLSLIGTKINDLDLTKNVLMNSLYIEDNFLSSVDFSKNVVLETLFIYNCGLSKINLTNNTLLTTADLELNKLTDIDISKNTKLKKVLLSGNQILAFNSEKNLNLEYLFLEGNKLTSLDLSKNLRLETMKCTKNNINSICISNSNQVTNQWYKDEFTKYQICN